MLTPKRRHLQHCSQYGTSGTECPPRSKLKCPYIIDWYDESGKRRQKSLRTNDWETAVKIINQMVLSGDKEPAKPSKTVAAAISDHFVEEESRGIRPSTLKSFHKFLDGNPKRNPDGEYSPTLVQFAATNGIVFLKDFNPDLVGKFRQQWKVGSAQESDGPPGFIGVLQRHVPEATNGCDCSNCETINSLWAS